MKRYIDKETGEKKAFGNLQVYAEAENTNERQFLGNFDSFKQILEYYEDYTPKEPLIKDEKIRSIVRAWIRANHLVGNIESYGGSTWIGLRGYSNNEEYWKIELKDNSNIKFGDYSLVELCGEEEE